MEGVLTELSQQNLTYRSSSLQLHLEIEYTTGASSSWRIGINFHFLKDQTAGKNPFVELETLTSGWYLLKICNNLMSPWRNPPLQEERMSWTTLQDSHSTHVYQHEIHKSWKITCSISSGWILSFHPLQNIGHFGRFFLILHFKPPGIFHAFPRSPWTSPSCLNFKGKLSLVTSQPPISMGIMMQEWLEKSKNHQRSDF